MGGEGVGVGREGETLRIFSKELFKSRGPGMQPEKTSMILKGEKVSLESIQRAPAPATFKPQPLLQWSALRAKSYATTAHLQDLQCNVMLLKCSKRHLLFDGYREHNA